MILLLSLAGVLLPHARLFRGESLLNLCHKATTFPVSQSFWIDRVLDLDFRGTLQ